MEVKHPLLSLADAYSHDKAMLDPSTLAERLRTAIIESKISQASIAEACGVTAQAISGWLRTGRIDKSHFHILSKLTKYPIEYFMVLDWENVHNDYAYLKHDPALLGLRPVHLWETPEDLPEDEYVIVPRLNLRFCAGNGGPVVEADADLGQGQAFRSSYMRRKRLNPKALLCAHAVGDSMEPRIRDGDSLLIDTSQREIVDGQVYAIAWDEELRVKRLYKMPGGGLLFRSDNRDLYPEMNIPLDKLHDIAIIGRVVLVSGDV